MSKEAEEFLEHHGVKGMKWGRRTAEVAKAARVNANNRGIANAQKAATRKIFPAPKAAARKLETLNASNARIASGNIKIKDILDVHSKIRLTDIKKAIEDADI